MTNSNIDIKPWRILIFAIFALTILRGIRFPNIWSYTHFLFNYDQGFIKRGFIGDIIGKLNNPFLSSYNFFFIFSITIFCVNIILLSLLIRDLIKSKDAVIIGLILVFVSSLAIVFLSHTAGYFDHIGLLVTLITIRINSYNKKMWFLLFAMPLALLIHEAILIIFYPVILMSIFLSIGKEKRKNKLLILGLFSGALLVATFFISSHILTKPLANEMYVQLQAKIPHPLRKDAFDVLTKDFNAAFDNMKNIWSSYQTIRQFVLSFIVIAPSFLLFICFTVSLLKKTGTDYYLIILAILASVSPMLLHFWGWDMDRWNTLTITTSFLMFCIVFIKESPQSVFTSRYLLTILFFIIFLNAISSVPLFDGYYVKQFPFVDHMKYLINLFTGKAAFPAIPLY